jgi:hypothetical protein
MKSTITLVLLALAAPAAFAADDIYRSVMPDGRILYGESAAPGAKSVKKVPPTPVSTGVTVVTPAEKSRNLEVQRGGVTVIPQPSRTDPGPAEQGRKQSPVGLPKRAY